MAKIYISSTFEDLEKYRGAVHRTLSQLVGHKIWAMENYVATDIRPLEKCRADIRQCDIYVGIIAWRYGFIPTEDNPEKKSITELEFETARSAGKHCLIFILDAKAAWPPDLMDSHTKKADSGERILQFRERLGNDFVVSHFKNPDELAGLVSTAVSNWVRIHEPPPPPPPDPDPVGCGVPEPREIEFSALLCYSPLDEKWVAKWAESFISRGLKLNRAPKAFFAETETDFRNLESSLITCHTVIAALTPAAVDQLRSRGDLVNKILRIMRDRTGYLGAALVGAIRRDLVADWPLTECFTINDPGPPTKKINDAITDKIARAIEARALDSRVRAVGLPVTVVAMTSDELKDLMDRPEQIRDRLGASVFDQFKALCQEMEKSQAGWQERYATLRENWKPFATDGRDVSDIVLEIAKDLNDKSPAELRQRQVKIQHYPFDEQKQGDPRLRCIYREIAQIGCVIIVDEMSMFHPDLREAFVASPFFSSPQVAIVTVSPFDPGRSVINQVLEKETRRKLAGAFERFALDYDPQCEFAVGDERRLRRWLHSSLPETMRNLRESPPNRNALKQFADEAGGSQARRGIGEHMFAGKGRP